jgi:transposase
MGQLPECLLEHEANTVVMEATGVYWKPVYYGLKGLSGELWLVNATHVKRVPGRKTDLSDAEWPMWLLMEWSLRASCRRHPSASCAS